MNAHSASPAVHHTARRSLFWPGFVLGLLLLTAFSCGGLTSILGLSDLSLSDLQGAGPHWTPSPATPTPATDSDIEPAAADVQTALLGTFRSGAQARNNTSSRVNIRRAPGHLGKPGDDIIAQMQPGDTVEILGGPDTADNLTWWLVRYTMADGTSIEGWVAEATSSGVQILGQAE